MNNSYYNDIVTENKTSRNFISVVILNWLRPENIRKKIIPVLIKSRLINQIIISHGRPDTYFKFHNQNNVEIINRKDFLNNDKYGLSLRFMAAISAKNNNILFIDDDQVPSLLTIEKIYYLYQKNYPGIVGKYGRNIGLNSGIKYCPNSISYQTDNIKDGRCDILLTSFLFVPKSLCYYFLTEKIKIECFVKKNSNPLWNGEDIFLSLLSIIKFKKLPFVANDNRLFPIIQLLTNKDKEVAISNKVNHLSYRTRLIRKILYIYKPMFILKKVSNMSY